MISRCGCLVAVLGALAASAWADDLASIQKRFAHPPAQYSTAPLWVWNDMLTEDQVRGTLRDLAGQKVMQAFVHPRPGLMTPYLSPDWFRLWRAALDEAEKLGMDLWIYDENSYPSGFAGGFVPELMPESQGRSLVFREVKKLDRPADDVVAVFRLKESGWDDVTADARAGKIAGAGRYLVATLVRSQPSPWYGGKTYVDLLYPGVTQKFLEVTLDAYKREIGSQFGKRVPGSFTDEPRLESHGGVPWTPDLPEQFKRRWGYDLMPHLPSLTLAQGDWKRVRHNFLQVLHELFVERWAKPYYEYCARNRLEFTGHYWEHEWPRCEIVPDNMAMYAWHQRPSIDCLMNQYKEDTHAQFGNVRMVKELSSVANQLGLQRTLCEAYGAGGWDLRFEDMKRIGDWLLVLGVNTIDEHLSYITLRGARKHDHPQSFSYHEPWWTDYHVVAEYLTRVSYILSQGKQVNPVLVLEPTTTAWMYQYKAAPEQKAKLTALGDQFQLLLLAMEREQVEYDLGCEDLFVRHGSVKTEEGSPAFVVGRRSYRTVVLPPGVENLNAKSAELLGEFLKQGGRVLSCGPAPQCVDGSVSKQCAGFAGQKGWQQVAADKIPGLLAASGDAAFRIRRAEDDKGILFHHRRVIDGGQFLFLINTSIEAPSAGTIECNAASVQRWDCETGGASPLPVAKGGGRTRFNFRLAPCGSLLVFLASEGKATEPTKPRASRPVAAAGQIEVRRLEPNVLTLDYVDVTAGGQTRKNAHFYEAGQFAFKQNGVDRNPWDSAVQFRDELIAHKFPPDSGVEFSYRFTIEKAVPKDLAIVVERPDLYKIACNGQPVQSRAGQWWLDRAFGKIDLSAVAKVGANEVTLTARPFSMFHEIQSAYVLGSFALRPAESGFAIAPDGPLAVSPKGWNDQGHPFYATGVSYAQNFPIERRQGRYRVSVPQWYGSVARVLVNGKVAGRIFHRPWECDVTDALVEGTNRIEVVVVGTLKNTLGPHHGDIKLGTAWPAMFRKGPPSGPPPGQKYNTVAYGLFAPFELLQTSADR